jgi:Ca2+-binding EF-hand superfamily protein
MGPAVYVCSAVEQTPMEPIRSTRLPLGPAYVPGQFQVRAQDIVPRYEQSNPMMVKLVDTHRALTDNKQQLIKEFEQIDAKKTGSLSKKDFTDSLKEVNQKCKLNIPRVLLDDLCEEAAEMFAPDKDPVNPHDIVYYKDFVSALQAPSPDTPQTLEEACIASSPKVQMTRTARFIERPRLHGDFSILERQKAHIIQNDLRTLLSLRRGLDPGSGTRETFLKMDTDRDGIIGKEDLRATLLELGMPMRDDSMELILSYCDMDGKGGIDFTSFVNNFEAIGRGWFNPFVPHKRLPEPPFRPRADQTSPVYANFYPPSSTPSRQVDLACVPVM